MQSLLDLTMNRILLDEKIIVKIFELMDKYGHLRLEHYFKFGILHLLGPIMYRAFIFDYKHMPAK